MGFKINIAIEEEDARSAQRELEEHLCGIGFVRVDKCADRELARMHDVLRAAGIDLDDLARRYDEAALTAFLNVSTKEAQ